MIFGGAADGRVYAFSKERGEILWMAQFKAPFASQPVLQGGRLYIGSEDGNLYALDQETGRTLWRYQTRGALRGPVAIAEETIFFGSADNYAYALRASDGRLKWRARTGAEVQAVAYTPSGLVVASLDNFVYFLSLRRGARLWKRQLAGRIASQPLASLDAALFAPLSGDACVVLDLKDGKQVNNLPVGEGNNMAASPVASGQMLLVTTRQGLLAFAGSANVKL
jgi:outer membrane protein assembly factor BamB